MKTFISFPLTNDPCGGGNQFLRNLKHELIELAAFTNLAEEADVILYNGHQNAEATFNLKKLHPEKLFVHRMDGLQKLYNTPDDPRQDLAINYNKISNATIFQSHWAKREFSKFGFNPKTNTVIHNSADSKLFNKNHIKNKNKKTELLCTSWSPNLKKGFNFYKKLDELLDFSKFNFTFIGNKPANIIYKNIKCLDPLTTSEIATYLQGVDIFVSATIDDCCSNSIIEALASGVPVLAQDSGGNPELVKDGGLLFKDIDDFLKNIEAIRTNIDFYRKMINIKTTKEIAADYINFFKCL
jgi:glycosyltransferase involved in cell wall biosynthesis